ncbi:MAG: hypothetical protein RIF33_14375 [Cyclobacteriaceae bacterium]
MKSINWKDHLVNLVVVILGISIAFYLEGWRGDREDRKLEIKYLNDLALDLEYDEQLLDTLLIVDSINIMKMDDILNRSANGQRMDFDGTFLDLVYYVPFTPKSVTYETIVNAGKLEVISSYEVQNNVVFLYNQLYGGVSAWDQYLTAHINGYIKPITMKGVKIKSDQISSSLLRNEEYINAIVINKNMLSSSMSLRKQTLEHIGLTKEMLVNRKERME